MVRNPTLAPNVAAHPVLSLAQTARQAEAYDRALWRIQPETPILLQDGKLCHHIVLAALAFQHRHPHHVQVPPSGFQTAAIMAVAGELVGISAATVGIVPVDWILTSS